MKHVYQRFLFKTASKVTEFFPKTLLWRQIRNIINSHISWPWKHLFASKIVLRVIVCCLRNVGPISSSRRVLRSCHRNVFFGAPLAFLRVVNPFRWLFRRCIVFMSSCHPFFLSSTSLHI